MQAIAIGPAFTMLANTIYAAPAVQCALFTTGSPAITQSNTSDFAASTAVTLTDGMGIITGLFLRCTTQIIVTLRKDFSSGAGGTADSDEFAIVNQDETITGNYDFTHADGIRITSPSADLWLHSTAGDVDYGKWRMRADHESFSLQAVTDAEAGFTNAFQAVRVAAIAQYFALKVPICFDSMETVTLSANQTQWNPTGFGKKSLFHVLVQTPGFTIRGIIAPGTFPILAEYIVMQVFNMSFPITYTHEDALASAVDRLWLPGATNIVAPAFSMIQLMYHGDSQRWVVLSKAV